MHIPNKKQILDFAKYYLVASFVFITIYAPINYLTSKRSDRVQLFFQWETQLPFVSMFIYGYVSIMLLFILPVFSLHLKQMRALCIAFCVATCLAGVIYLILPAELAHQRPNLLPQPTALFFVLYSMALPHNLFPSLHITYSTLLLLVIVRQEQSYFVSGVALGWMVVICLSIILIRQHHIIDMIGGWVLGVGAYKFVYLKKMTAIFYD